MWIKWQDFCLPRKEDGMGIHGLKRWSRLFHSIVVEFQEAIVPFGQSFFGANTIDFNICVLWHILLVVPLPGNSC